MATGLIQAAELAARIQTDGASETLAIIDCRFELNDTDAGRRQWQAGHVPGAIYADLEQQMSDMSVPGQGRHPLPSLAELGAWLNAHGVTPQHTIVLYDHDTGALAARMWWLLQQLKADRVLLLDGGWTAWCAAEGNVSKHPPTRRPHQEASWSPGQYSGVVSTPQLQRMLDTGTCLLVDARAANRFTGAFEPLDRKAGHVPGAVNRPFSRNLNAQGRWQSVDALRQSWTEQIEPVPTERVVHMCGSGVTACHNMLAMTLAGLHGSSLYAPSFSGWIDASADRPVATS